MGSRPRVHRLMPHAQIPPGRIEWPKGNLVAHRLSPVALRCSRRGFAQFGNAAQPGALPASANTDAEPRSINANAGLTIVIAIVAIVALPGSIIVVSGDHPTVTPGLPALAGVVTNESRLMKQRRTLSDLDLVSRIGARRHEGASAGEKRDY